MGDVVAEFCEITGASEETAMNYLTMTDFALPDALAIFFAADDGHQQTQQRAAPVSSRSPPPPSRSHQPSRGGDHHQYVSRLADDMEDRRMHGMPPMMVDPIQQLLQRANMDLFRETPPRVEEVPSDTENEDLSNPVAGHNDPIAELFSKPSYSHRGTFAACCEDAVSNNRWVILNILRRRDFASGCLNRDIWRDSLVSDMIPAMYNLYQVLHDSDEGALLVSSYRLESRSIPSILIVHPLTKALVHEVKTSSLSQKNGTYNVTTFLDVMTTFIEKNPPSFARIPTFEDLSDQRLSSGGSQGFPHVTDVDNDEDDSEDAQLARALEESRRTAMIEEAVSRRSVPEEMSPPPPHQKQLKAEGREAPPVEPPAAPAFVEPVDIAAFVHAPPTSTSYRLRVRVPQGQVELCVDGSIPVTLLVRYLSYTVCQSNPQQYPTLPEIELRGGFPPKALVLPDDASVTLQRWGAVRQSDSVTVHIV